MEEDSQWFGLVGFEDVHSDCFVVVFGRWFGKTRMWGRTPTPPNIEGRMRRPSNSPAQGVISGFVALS
jgi:hypothetical protein